MEGVASKVTGIKQYRRVEVPGSAVLPHKIANMLQETEAHQSSSVGVQVMRSVVMPLCRSRKEVPTMKRQ